METTTAHSVDVIVIGAGLSGLQAAHDIQQAGKSCLVLEARDRVGGRTWSAPVGKNGGIIELGAAWYNDVSQPNVTKLVETFNLETIEQNTIGDCIMRDYGSFPYGDAPNLSSHDRDSFIKLRDEIERLCHTVDAKRPGEHEAIERFKDQSFADLAKTLGATPLVQGIASIWTRAMLGKEASDCSALYCLMYFRSGGGFLIMRSDRKGGGQAIRIRQGTQSLSIGLAASLKKGSVLLNQVVTNVDQTPDQLCTVTTSSGRSFHSRKVIVSLPTPLYKTISFTPDLSADKRAVVDSTSLGFYGKVHLIYSTPWWRDRGLCGLTQAVDGPIAITRDTSSDNDGLYGLTCFTAGPVAAEWYTRPAADRRDEILRAMDTIYGMECPKPVEYIEFEWAHEEFTRGCPCASIPNNALEAWDRDQWRPEGNLFFVGTETSSAWRGYMEGALASGVRGAQEVLASMDGSADTSTKTS